MCQGWVRAGVRCPQVIADYDPSTQLWLTLPENRTVVGDGPRYVKCHRCATEYGIANGPPLAFSTFRYDEAADDFLRAVVGALREGGIPVTLEQAEAIAAIIRSPKVVPLSVEHAA